jgi:hypothetical protein
MNQQIALMAILILALGIAVTGIQMANSSAHGLLTIYQIKEMKRVKHNLCTNNPTVRASSFCVG